MRILVITSCTGRKKHKPPNQLTREDFVSSDRLCRRTAELKDFKTPAAEMYTGQQHRYLMAGLKEIREVYGSAVVDLYIISAGYGLLCENKVIVPYNVTFGKRDEEIFELSDSLQIHECVESLIAGYDLVFFLLGKEYVQALQLPFAVPDTVTQIFLLGDTYRELIPNLPNIYFVPAGKPLRSELNTTYVALKGVVFKKICERVCHDGLQVFEKIRYDPQRIRDLAHMTGS